MDHVVIHHKLDTYDFLYYLLNFHNQEYKCQGDPESAVGDKRAVAEVVADLEFLVTGYELRHAAKRQSAAEDYPGSAQTEIMKLK